MIHPEWTWGELEDYAKKLEASNAELLAACQKAIHVWDHNVDYQFIAGELEDIVPELRAAVAHAQEATP